VALSPNFRPAAEWLVAVARAYLGGGTVTSTSRSAQEQASLVRKYQGVQVCPVGSSLHELGLAFDFVVAAGSSSLEQQWLGAVWNYYVAPTWSPNDPVHFAAGSGCLKR